MPPERDGANGPNRSHTSHMCCIPCVYRGGPVNLASFGGPPRLQLPWNEWASPACYREPHANPSALLRNDLRSSPTKAPHRRFFSNDHRFPGLAVLSGFGTSSRTTSGFDVSGALGCFSSQYESSAIRSS